ncbi:MAG: Maf family protein [Cellvibrionaceae bacterium]
MLYLASQSPRRREILDQIGVDYRTIPQNIDEGMRAQEAPETYVQRLALEKAISGLDSINNPRGDERVLGADTIVVFDGHILGKPKDRKCGCDMLMTLSGQKHTVMSGIAIASKDKSEYDISKTDVFFRTLDKSLIDRYWESTEPCDKAGGYGIQGRGGIFVEKIIGSYSGVVGLPIEKLFPLLEKFNIPFWN